VELAADQGQKVAVQQHRKDLFGSLIEDEINGCSTGWFHDGNCFAACVSLV